MDARSGVSKIPCRVPISYRLCQVSRSTLSGAENADGANSIPEPLGQTGGTLRSVPSSHPFYRNQVLPADLLPKKIPLSLFGIGPSKNACRSLFLKPVREARCAQGISHDSSEQRKKPCVGSAQAVRRSCGVPRRPYRRFPLRGQGRNDYNSRRKMLRNSTRPPCS